MHLKSLQTKVNSCCLTSFPCIIIVIHTTLISQNNSFFVPLRRSVKRTVTTLDYNVLKMSVPEIIKLNAT